MSSSTPSHRLTALAPLLAALALAATPAAALDLRPDAAGLEVSLKIGWSAWRSP